MPTLTKKSLYAPEVYETCRARIEQIQEDTRPQWGVMSAAQMFAHCAEVQEVANGKALGKTPLLAKLFKGFIRQAVVNDKPYPKSSRTHPQYEQREERDFFTEKQRLLAALERFFHEDKDEAVRRPHPLFGTMTLEERGWSMYKHLDHHLTQFGV